MTPSFPKRCWPCVKDFSPPCIDTIDFSLIRILWVFSISLSVGKIRLCDRIEQMMASSIIILLVASHLTRHPYLSYILLTWANPLHSRFQSRICSEKQRLVQSRQVLNEKAISRHNPSESGSETCMRLIYWSCRSSGWDHVPAFSSSLAPLPHTHSLYPLSFFLPSPPSTLPLLA